MRYLHFPSISWDSNYMVPKVPRLDGRSYPVSTGQTALDNMVPGQARTASERSTAMRLRLELG